MVFFSPFKKKQKKMTPWYALLGLIVVAAAFGLKIYDGLKPQITPTSDLPAVSYLDVVDRQLPTPAPQPVTEVEDGRDGSPTRPYEEGVQEVVEPVPLREPKALVEEMNLAVPFTSQAPTSNWDALHEDACEEASIYMVMQYFAGMPAGKIDPAVADPELQRLVHVGESLGQGLSINLDELKDLLMKDSNTTSQIIDNPTVGDIKLLISMGLPVIVPAAGRELGNPNFTGAGPLYHMLVIRGYTDTTFVTNDPGTRLGENYIYDIDVIMNAIGDWNNGDPTTGPKRILYIDPK